MIYRILGYLSTIELNKIMHSKNAGSNGQTQPFG